MHCCGSPEDAVGQSLHNFVSEQLKHMDRREYCHTARFTYLQTSDACSQPPHIQASCMQLLTARNHLHPSQKTYLALMSASQSPSSQEVAQTQYPHQPALPLSGLPAPAAQQLCWQLMERLHPLP